MTKRLLGLAAALGLATAAFSPLAAQAPATPRVAASQVAAGSYVVDANHTQVVWSVDHFGFSRLYGMVGGMSGTLAIDPARPSEASVQIDIPLSGLTVTSPGFAKHLQTADLFDTAKFPTARFVSRNVAVSGETAAITGDLTVRGVTRPITLNARFHGAGTNPMNKKATVGFSATGTLKRSDFGLGYAVPAVSDEVRLEITAAFEK
ncbi:YceI family protein [Sphingomonas sp. LHG3406-1]|uniref:YceI family protein n=1 Tax=Sphingomonas sp. LHG3406-1 TaxID=2804617 RepID=UPI002626BDDB|nr:YceI family protein [Sphingomonas sp. LHG3406-1]